jgi:lipopolysaccharide cholinephosphotransferase
MGVDQSNPTLHKNILYLAKYFDKFCGEHSLDYFLLGGTALGAVRHDGFIPWDDDFDVCMDYKNYYKFLSLWEEFGKKDIVYLQAEDTVEWPLLFSKLRLNNTLYMEEDDYGRDMHNGVYIDIMCLNNVFDNVALRFSQYIAAKILCAAAVGRRGYQSGTSFKKLVAKVSRVIVTDSIKRALLSYVRCVNSKDNSRKYYSHFFGRAKFKFTVIPKDIFYPKRTISFEGYPFQVMSGLERYLEIRFGSNYMDMPSQAVLDEYPLHCKEFRGLDSIE